MATYSLLDQLDGMARGFDPQADASNNLSDLTGRKARSNQPTRLSLSQIALYVCTGFFATIGIATTVLFAALIWGRVFTF
jgi:hypothetical protein